MQFLLTWWHLLQYEYYISMGKCKEDITPLLMHWSYVFLALTLEILEATHILYILGWAWNISDKVEISHHVNISIIQSLFSFLPIPKPLLCLYGIYDISLNLTWHCHPGLSTVSTKEYLVIKLMTASLLMPQPSRTIIFQYRIFINSIELSIRPVSAFFRACQFDWQTSSWLELWTDQWSENPDGVFGGI